MSAVAAVQTKAAGRLLFVDNIRVFLTILVLLHHLMITYAGTGAWYYTEGRQDFVTNALGGWFCATNQAYFMGLFLLISAYFVPGSYDRKGAGRFLKDRLIRLGIPLAVYSWVINPLFWYAFFFQDIRMPFWRFFPGEYFKSGELIGTGRCGSSRYCSSSRSCMCCGGFSFGLVRLIRPWRLVSPAMALSPSLPCSWG